MANLNLNFDGLTKLKEWWGVTKSNFTSINNQVEDHISGTTDKHNSQNINYIGNIPDSTNVKDGLDNVYTRLDNHIDGISDNHTAMDISFVSTRPSIDAHTVKEAIDVVDIRVDTLVNNPSPDKDLELVDIRTSNKYGVFATAKGRIDNVDSLLSLHLSYDVNLKDFVQSGDNGDYMLALIRAIAYIRANNLSVIKFPLGNVEFKTNIGAEIDYPGIVFIGSGNSIGGGTKTQILDSRPESSTPLFTFAGACIGFRIENIIFNGQMAKRTCLYLKQNCGWDYYINQCAFIGYKGSAMRTAASDGYVTRCLFNQCGTLDATDNSVTYCIEFEGNANMQHFNSCHFEHCRFFVNIYTGFMNYFHDCKFEQSGAGLNHPSSLAPIEINKTGFHTCELAFSLCTFISASEKAYIIAKEINDLSTVPYFININSSGLSAQTEVTGINITSCVSRCGTGSSIYSINLGYMSLIKSRAKTNIIGGIFNALSGTRYSIDMKVGTISGGACFNFKHHVTTTYETQLPNNGYGISVSNYCSVTGCYFYAMYYGDLVDVTKNYAITYNQLDYSSVIGAKAVGNIANFGLYPPSFKSDNGFKSLTLGNGFTGYVNFSYENSLLLFQINVTAPGSQVNAGAGLCNLPRYAMQDYSYMRIRNATANTDTLLRIEGNVLRVTENIPAGTVLKGAGIMM